MSPEENDPFKFFSDPNNLEVLVRFRDQLKTLSPEDRSDPDVVPSLETIIVSMIRSKGQFDKYCKVNIEWVGSQFISRIISFQNADGEGRKRTLISIFEMAYRFVKEFEFSLPAKNELGGDLSMVRSFVQKNVSFFEKNEFSDLIFAEYLMPSYILKELVNNPAINEFKDMNSKIDQVKKLKENWDSEIKGKQERLDALNANVEKLLTKYNFVGLSKGFQDLLGSKSKDKRIAYLSLLVMGGVMVVLLSCEIIFAATHIDQIDLYKSTLIYILPAIVAMQVLLFYFFRVILVHYNSLKAQILQLDLRVSLCQFIQGYAEYAREIKKNDGSVLDRFEQLIFSGLVASDADIPSTFDGVEQIAKLVASIKSPS